MMAPGDCARALTKSLGAQDLAADRANEFFAGSSIARAAK
jgi:hypothetical protein